MNGILSGMPNGALMDPNTVALLQTGLGLMANSGPSRTPVSLGQAFGQAGQQGLQAFQQATQAQQQQQLFSMKLAEVQRQEDERKKKEAAIAQLMQDPRFKGLESLLQVAPQAAIEQAMPKPKAPEPFKLRPGETQFGPDGKPIVALPPAPEKEDDFTKALKAAGIQPGTPEHARLIRERLAKMTTHPPQPNVSVKVDNKTGESLAKPIGEMVQETRNMALGGLDQIDAGNRIITALDSGKVITGPGSKARVFLKQLGVAAGLGGKDDAEILQNTRQVVKGLAEFTLSARKQLKGQGQVSDYEGKLIQQAASGDIDNMTDPEIRTVVEVSDRLARKSHELHRKNLDTIRSKPEYSTLADFYTVPDLPAAPTKPSVAQTFDKLPPALKFKGKTIRDTDTGKMMRSDGMSWKEVK